MASVQLNGQSALTKIGARLRSLRLKHGLTLRELGRRVGLTDACINQWETGRSFPRPNNLERVAKALSTSVAYLVAGDDDGVSDPTVGAAALASDRATGSAADVIGRARRDIAHALGLPVSHVRVELGKPSSWQADNPASPASPRAGWKRRWTRIPKRS